MIARMEDIMPKKRARKPDLSAEQIRALMGKLPDDAPEAEMSLLGSMILCGSSNLHIIADVMGTIGGPEDFAAPKHGALYSVLTDLYDKNQSVDSVQIIQALRDRKMLGQFDDGDYVVQLAESVPIAENAPHYARIVRDKAKVRRLVFACGELLHDAMVVGIAPDDLLDRAENAIYQIGQTRETNQPVAMADFIEQTFNEMEALQGSGQTITGLDCGFWQLNEILAGLQNGDSILLAARPSIGKTALAMCMAKHIAVDTQIPTVVFSLEMSKAQLAKRMMSVISRVDGQRARRNMLTPPEVDRMRDAMHRLSASPLFIDDTPAITINELRAKARRLKQQKNIQAVFIDYLQLMKSPGAENKRMEIGEISNGLKALARELDVPVVCLSQLNRNPEARESKRPVTSDLRESGELEQDADVVLLLHREDHYKQADDNYQPDNMAQLIVGKQRNGGCGVIPLHFDAATTAFDSVAHDYMPVPESQQNEIVANTERQDQLDGVPY